MDKKKGVFIFLLMIDYQYINGIKTPPCLEHKVTGSFVKLDSFHKEFASQPENRPQLQDSKIKRRNRKGKLSDSEMMSIYLLFHFGQFTNFKHFYQQYVCKHLEDLFPDLVSSLAIKAIYPKLFLNFCSKTAYSGLPRSEKT